MRVYEFSKKFNIPSKQLLEMLKEGGFDVTTHMAVLDDKQVSYLEKKLTSEGSKKVVKEVAAKSLAVSKDETPKEKTKSPVSKKFIPKKKKKEKIEAVEPEESAIIIQDMSLGDLADKLDMFSSELILYLLRQGIVCSKNQILSSDVVDQVAKFYEKETIQPKKTAMILDNEVELVVSDKLQDRLPIVAVVGHVDHGKTTLLDFIRKTRVTSRERGGITQHLGAYEAKTKHGNIVFLDTPGHEAFSKIRMRGIKAADIVILIVAADDGIMPQTAEAIRHAKAMNVPILVAINKIDKADSARVEVVKGQLAKYELLPEEWGGEVVCVAISAKEGTGVDHLLEMITLQSQLMELKADPVIEARGYVLESRLEKGRGPVATVICQHGQLRIGDYFVCGSTFGKVNSLVDSSSNRVDLVGPSIPVKVAGFNDLAQVGDYFEVVSAVEFKKAKSSQGKYRTPLSRTLFNEDALGVIVKADTHASQEVLTDAIERLATQLKEHKELYIIHAGVGDINESDIILASNTKAVIVGFNAKIDTNASLLAQRQGVKISQFQIIYKLLDYLQAFIEKHKTIEMVQVKIGEAIVRRVFDIKGVGVIAGSYVKDGRFTRDCMIKAWRGRELIGEGKIRSLQRERKAVKEVHAGYECGFIVDSIDAWEVEDRAECYIEKPAQE